MRRLTGGFFKVENCPSYVFDIATMYLDLLCTYYEHLLRYSGGDLERFCHGR